MTARLREKRVSGFLMSLNMLIEFRRRPSTTHRRLTSLGGGEGGRLQRDRGSYRSPGSGPALVSRTSSPGLRIRYCLDWVWGMRSVRVRAVLPSGRPCDPACVFWAGPRIWPARPGRRNPAEVETGGCRGARVRRCKLRREAIWARRNAGGGPLRWGLQAAAVAGSAYHPHPGCMCWCPSRRTNVAPFPAAPPDATIACSAPRLQRGG